MRIEEGRNFGKERMRMPDRKYDDHSIGDHCPLNPYPGIAEVAKAVWRQLRYGGIIKEELKRLREYLILNSGHLDSRADFEAGTNFYPDEYPHGTIILVGREADIYTTYRTRVLKRQYRTGFYEGPDLWLADKEPDWKEDGTWLEKEYYNDRQVFRGNDIGLVIRFPSEDHNQTMIIDGSREQIQKGTTSLHFLKGGLILGLWNHYVFEEIDPMYLWHPEKNSHIQNDTFVHGTGVKIIQPGQGVKEKARKPLEGLSSSVRRAFGST